VKIMRAADAVPGENQQRGAEFLALFEAENSFQEGCIVLKIFGLFENLQPEPGVSGN
jgi:hypothetical protein